MKLPRFVTVMLVGSFVLAACGGGDGTDAASPAAGDGGSASGAAGGAGGAIDAARCAQVVTAMSAAAAAVPQAMSGEAGDLSTSLAQLQAFAEAAPEEIKADLMTVYQGYGAFVQAMQDAGYDPSSGQPPPPEAIAAMQQATQLLDDADFKAASDRVQAWFAENCGA
ncbi:MAG: hypothetical protein ACXWX5_02115 [Actinomycetota bacterium]